MIQKALERIKQTSFQNLRQDLDLKTEEIISGVKSNLIYIVGNDFFYYENGNIRFKTTCVTGINGFGNEKVSNKTPTGLHVVSELIGDGEDKFQKFEARIPTIIETPVNNGELKSGVYGRILRLDGLEINNQNTLSRAVYIHGNIHDWYWKTEDLKRSYGCIGLKLDEVVMLFNIIKYYNRKIFVLIDESK